MNSDSGNIADYIRQHRDTYTREAIEEQLLEAGYGRADIEAGWEEVDSPPRPQRKAPSVGAWVLLGLLWLLMFLIAGVLQTGTNIVLGWHTLGGKNDLLLGILNFLFFAFEIGILVTGIVLLYRNRSLGRALGTITALSFVWYVIITGSCLYR